MKKPRISFRIIGDSGPLSAYFYPGPYGDAIEANSGNGVGWFSPSKELLGVEFDDVSADLDHQTLVFSGGYKVEVHVKYGRPSVRLKSTRLPLARSRAARALSQIKSNP